ncbi:MAG: hypothetical protein ABR500_07235 [Dermatophilaceae bacterium]|nr:histidine phosphatase family protein [Intrasporangiaceae bacterium]
MSLHCPATLLVAGHEGDTRALADGLRDRRVVAVYTSGRAEAERTGRALAEELGAVLEVDPGLDVDPPDRDESAEDAVVRIQDGLGSVADLHRGETVLVLAPLGPGLQGTVVHVEIGDDGVRIGP